MKMRRRITWRNNEEEDEEGNQGEEKGKKHNKEEWHLQKKEGEEQEPHVCWFRHWGETVVDWTGLEASISPEPVLTGPRKGNILWQVPTLLLTNCSLYLVFISPCLLLNHHEASRYSPLYRASQTIWLLSGGPALWTRLVLKKGWPATFTMELYQYSRSLATKIIMALIGRNIFVTSICDRLWHVTWFFFWISQFV